MRTKFLALYVATFLAGPALADFEATAPDGRTVVLKDNFTWHYKQSTGQSSGYVIDNWNPASCSMTNNARFNLPTDTFVARLATWYNWENGQQTATAGFYNSQGGTIVQGQIRRGSCDSYQPNWCEGIMEVRQSLAAGQYVLEVSPARICYNAGSN